MQDSGKLTPVVWPPNTQMRCISPLKNQNNCISRVEEYVTQMVLQADIGN